MKNTLIILMGIFGFAGMAFALPFFSQTASMVPDVTDSRYIGTSTPSTLEYNGIFTKNLTVSGTCTGCGSGGLSFSYLFLNNATTTAIAYNGGIIINASSSLPYLGSGELAVNNGLLYSGATSTLATITGTLAVAKGGTGVTSFTASNLLYGGSNGTALGFLATTTLSGSGLISVTAGAFTLGSSPITVSCSTCGAGTVTSISSPNSTLSVGGTSAVPTLDLNFAHSNFWTALQNFTLASTSQLTATSSAYFATVNGTVGVGTTTPFAELSVHAPINTNAFAVGSSTTSLLVDNFGKTQVRDSVNQWTGIITPTSSFVLSVGTTTQWMASTTGSAYSPVLLMPFDGTLQDTRCLVTGTSTALFLGVNVQVNGSNATPSYFVASSTVGKETFTAGNTFLTGQKILMNVGTTTISDGQNVSCTFDATQTK